MGFESNPYDLCVANSIIDGSQCTICWYVDDNKISHKSPAVVDKVIQCIESKFGKMSTTRGNVHEFLGMHIQFKDKKVKINMKNTSNKLFMILMRILLVMPSLWQIDIYPKHRTHPN